MPYYRRKVDANMTKQRFDLSTADGRFKARRAGLDVPLLNQHQRPFWDLVQKGSGCWLFTGRLNRDGYGQYGVSGIRTRMAHRLAWIELRGAIPSGAVLMHTCDVPNCVNPDHLRIGTPRQNQMDKVAKGRHAIGSGNGLAILNEAAAADIRARYRPQTRPGAGDGNVKALAAEYGVCLHVVWKIVKRQLWKHVA